MLEAERAAAGGDHPPAACCARSGSDRGRGPSRECCSGPSSRACASGSGRARPCPSIPSSGCGCPDHMPNVEVARIKRCTKGEVLDCAECGRLVLR